MINKKIITIAVSAVLILALAGVGIYGAVTSGNKGNDETTVSTQDGVSQDSSAVTPSGEGDTVQSTAPDETLAQQILGKWTDSANMSGYAFYEDGTVEVTYVNLTVPIVNIPINGTAKGVYTLEGDKLTTKFSIYSATIEDSFTVKIEKNILSMYNLEERETSTYSRASEDTTTAATNPTSSTLQADVDGTDIIGSWINSDGTVKYKFNTDGTAKVSFKDAEVPDIGETPVTGSYSGVYMIIDDEITIQYTAEGKKITEKYTFAAAKNSLSLKKGRDTTLFVREGTTFSPSTEGELLGKWMDGANMSGYEMLEGGVVKVTYVNFTVPVINMPINGTYTGSYTVEDNQITMNYSIYGNSITNKFTFSIENNVLTLIDEEGDTSTYIKQ